MSVSQTPCAHSGLPVPRQSARLESQEFALECPTSELGLQRTCVVCVWIERDLSAIWGFIAGATACSDNAASLEFSVVWDPRTTRSALRAVRMLL